MTRIARRISYSLKKKKKFDNFLDAKIFQGPAHSPILYLNLLLALTDLNPR